MFSNLQLETTKNAEKEQFRLYILIKESDYVDFAKKGVSMFNCRLLSSGLVRDSVGNSRGDHLNIIQVSIAN